MAKYPDVQSRAQKEIDDTIGTERLPQIVDRANLPYLDAVIKETMRWNPVLPLSEARGCIWPRVILTLSQASLVARTRTTYMKVI